MSWMWQEGVHSGCEATTMTYGFTGRAREALARLGTALFSAAVTAAPAASAAFYDSFSAVRLGVVLAALLLFYFLTCPRIFFCREFVLYALLAGYLALSTAWTPDQGLVLNTLVPAVNFIVLLVLAGSLVAFHELRVVLTGMLGGFLIVMMLYGIASGFPFTYPPNFSYNAIAGLYLFGLFCTLIFAWAAQAKLLPLVLALIVLLHVAATTSIKTNLGILLGTLVAAFVYFRFSLQLLRRNAAYIVVAAIMILTAVVASERLVERLQAGIDRVSLGVEVLADRDNVAGYGGYATRQYWLEEGIRGWQEKPIFGRGVEAFRSRYGTTSHSTVVDLLYNTGLVGFALFYAVFASALWRLRSVRGADELPLKALILAMLVCQVFISLSGTLFYQTFLAISLAMSMAVLRRLTSSTLPAVSQP